MSAPKPKPAPHKISPAFQARLDRMGPKETVRVVLLLQGPSGKTRRGDPAGRKALAAQIRRRTGRALKALDSILEQHGGQRLAKRPTSLGSLPVETTAGGVRALAGSRYVKSILEDQTISLLP